MRKFILFLIVLYLFPQIVFCQTAGIKGKLADSTATENPVNAVVAILNQKDSTLVTFSRSDKNGNFQISHLDSGHYVILISYPKYGDFVDHIQLKKNENLDLKTIYLTQKAKLLQEIVIKQAAMRLKGDTTEYNADSYEVKPNATVEDLLKQLPGIQVDKDGKITAQGQQIQKVLVDGDEFFSDDPTIATRNLRADAVSKVQVFDKKSDQAEFTGIDDGNTTKTLNLKLKDNAKHGYFGKVSASALDKYYNGQALINAFKGKRKLAAFVIGSSTDATGLNWQDSQNYGFQSDNIQVMEGGGIMITSNSSDDLGTQNYYGQGLPESVKAGLHFSNKWGTNDKYNLGGNYLFNKLAVRSSGNTYTQNILADSVYYNRQSADNHTDKLRHTLSGTADIQIDSSSSVRITANGFVGTTQSSSNFQSQSLSEENNPVNSSVRKTSSNGNNSALNANALWRKKFKKKGRTLSVNFEERYNLSNSNGFLNNISDFYDIAGNIIKKDSTDQNKINDNESNVTGVRATYTEPLSKKSFLEFNYSFYNNSSTQKRFSYDKDLGGKYSDLVDSLSNDFRYIYNTHSGGLNYRFNDKKINFSFGGNIANTAFQQTDLVKDTTRKYNYYNLAPQANFNYKFNPYSGIRFNYNGNTQQPTIDQLQPLKNNDDPLNIIVGNPSLKQKFQNRFNLSYNNYKVLSERSIYIGTYFTSTHNDISSTYTIDSFGKRTTKYINVNGNFSGNLYGGYYIKIPKTKFRTYLRPSLYISHNNNFINGLENLTKSFNASSSIGLGYYKEEKYNFDASFTPSYSQSKSSISTVASTHYWTYNYSFNGSIYPVKKLEIGTDIDFNFRQKLNQFDKNNDVIVWNAFIEKKFLKKDALTIRASINDILNQNKGYDRTIQPFSIVEKHYLTFQRYGLITVTWNFNNKGGAGAPKSMF
ncbi:MAG TPA: outer membrane beta-barrel protein [Hanamia sp.]|nr:outer membrane beta-barrel protein [Hanamia sp.]